MRTLICLFLGLAPLSIGIAGCSDGPTKRPIGGTCSVGEDCESGICGDGVCLDPVADEDGDSLTNGLEAQLGSSPTNPDSDGDGLRDDTELDDGLGNVDTDGDGDPDISESAKADPDQDCIPDQFDSEDQVANSDLSPMIDVVCSTAGVCAGQRAAFGVECPDGVNAQCIYTAVPGWSNPEATCDAVDENCDGTADEAFPDRDDDAIADCVDSDWDNDAVADGTDNCPTVANAEQSDADGDGVGDLCVSLYTLFFVDSPLQATVGLTFGVNVGIDLKEGDAAAPPPPFRGAVTLVLDADGGPATLVGNASATAGDDRVARFTDLGVTAPGTGLRLVATSGGLGTAESNPFDARSGAVARFAIEGLPATLTAGVSAPITITALDANDNAILDYAGVVRITATDPDAAADGEALGAGLDTTLAGAPAAIAFFAAGAQTLTVTEVDGVATGSATTTVEAAAVERLEVAPTLATVPASVPFAVDVTARDAFDNVATDFAGEVTLSASDAGATLPGPHTYVAGDAGTFRFADVVLVEAGLQTLTATGPEGVTGSAEVTVEAGGVAQIDIVTAPTSAVAGVPFDVTIALRDADGNLVADGSRTLHFTANDGTSEDITVTTATTTLTGFGQTTAGTYTVTISIVGTGVSDTFTVDIVAAAATRLAMTSAPSVVAGVAHTVGVTAYDAYDNVATGYRGTLTFTTSDAAGTAPSAYSFTADDAGTAQIGGFVGRTAAGATLGASDAGSALATSVGVTYTPAAAARLDVTGLPASVVAGVATGLTVTAYDEFGNIATGYRGTVALTTTDPEGTTPASHVYVAGDNGAFVFTGIVLETAGNQTVTARDAAANLTDAVGTTVVAAAATRLDVALGAVSVPAGVPTSVTLTARDAFGNVARGYLGTVEFGSGDALATLPADYTFTADDFGVRTLGGVTFRTVGVQTLVATDVANPSVTGSDNLSVDEGSDVVYVLEGAPTLLAAGAAFGVTLRVEDLFGNPITDYTGTVHVDSDDPQDVMPADYVFSGTEGGVRTFTGLVLKTSGSRRLTLTDTSDTQITTSAIIDVTPGAMSTLTLSCTPTTLDAGTTSSCTVRAVDTYGNTASGYRGTVTFGATDPEATLPPPTAFTAANAGVRSFPNGFVFETAGSIVLTAADGAVSDNVTFTVDASGLQSLRLVPESTTPTAGQAFYVDVSARDQFGNVQNDFNGSVAFTLSSGCDTHANAALVGGVARVTGFRCTTAGARQIDAATTGAASASGSVGVTVAPAALDHFAFTPSTATPTAGVAFGVTVSPRDVFDNTRAFTGSMTFTMPTGCDAHAAAAITNDTLVPGFRCTAAGARSLSGTAGGRSGAANVTVQSAALDHFTFTPSTSTPTAGATFTLQVLPRDAFENGVFFSGTMTFPAVAGCDAHANANLVDDTVVTGFRCTAAGAKTLSGSAGGKSGATTVTVAAAALDHFTLVPSTATPNAGASFDLAVRPRDVYENPVAFSGPVTFLMPAGCDAHAPEDVTNDETVTGFRCTAAGAKSLGATGGGRAGNTSVTVQALPLHHFSLTPSSTIPSAGQVFSIQVRARDDYDNLIPFSGTMTFTMPAGCDPHADATLDGDDVVIDFRCTLAGTKTITGTAGGKQGSTTIDVGAAAPHHFAFTPTPASPKAGHTFAILIEPRDAFDNAVSYTGNMVFTTPAGCDPRVDVTITNLTNVAGFRCTLVGAKTISGTASGVSGSTSVTVVPNDLDSFGFEPSTTTPTAGVSFTLTIRPRDAYGNAVTYAGTMTLPAVSRCFFPSTVAISNVTVVSNVYCEETGAKTIGGTASGKSGSTTLDVQPGALESFGLTVTSVGVTAGTTFSVTVQPRDGYNNPRPFTGPMTFTVTPAGSCTLPTPNPVTITDRTTVEGFACTKSGASTIRGTAGGKFGTVVMTVYAGPTSKLVVTLSPASIVAGVAELTPTVEAVDVYGNRATDYQGTVTFAVDAGNAVLPANYKFVPATDQGLHTFGTPKSSLDLAGTRIVNARDTITASITDDTAPTVTVVPAAPASLEWKTHPTNGRVNETLATSEVQLKDALGNVCTNVTGRAIALRVGTNPNEAVLSGTLSVNTTAGVSAFSTLKLDQHGTGFTLVASSTGLTSVTSNPFNLSWSAPTFVGTPTSTTNGGCTSVGYTLAQAGGGPATITATYTIDGGTAFDATQLGAALGVADGLIGLTTTPAGAAHTFLWDNFTDLGAIDDTGIKVNLTATMPDGTSATSGTNTFAVAARWTATWRPTAIGAAITPGKPGAGDIDQDGFPDLAIPGANRFVIMYYDRPSGLYKEKAIDTAQGLHSVAAVADMNGDMVPDVIMAESDKDELTIALSTIVGPQDVSFTYETAGRVCGGTAGISDIVAANFDRDNQMDVAVACSGVKQVRIWTRDGDAKYSQVALISDIETPRALATIDWGVNGYLDLALGTDNAIAVIALNVQGAWVIADSKPATNVSDVAVGDLDRDGINDIAFTYRTPANQPTTMLGIYFGKTPSSLEGGVVEHDMKGAVDSLEIGEVNRDGALDVVFGSTTRDEIVIASADDFRDSAVSIPRIIVDTGTAADGGPNRVIITDVTGDGRPDIAAARALAAAGRTAGFVRSEPSRQCEPRWDAPRPAATPDLASGMAWLVDLNKDGKLDLVQASGIYGAERITISYGRGDGAYETDPHIIVLDTGGNTDESPVAVAFGDMNKDGLVDVVVQQTKDASGIQGPVRRFHQTNPYAFTEGAALGSGSEDVVVTDLDLDGDDDVARLATTGTLSTLSISYQGSAGAFSAGPNIALGDYVWDVEAMDVNRDGVPDFVVKRDAITADLCVVVSTSNSPAAWSATLTCTNTGIAAVTDLQLADLNGDGRKDVVYGASNAVVARTITTAGAWSTSESWNLCTTLRGISIADVDKQRGLDLVLMCNTDTSLPGMQVYPQQATLPRFNAQDYVAFARGWYRETNVAAGDVDGGYADVVFEGLTWRNASAPLAFEEPPALSITSTTLESPGRMEVFDYDGDGDQDVLSAEGANSFWLALQSPSGGFGTSAYNLASTEYINALATGDFNGDERPDMAISYWRSSPSAYLVDVWRRPVGGTGPWSGSGVPVTLAGTPSTGLAVANLDVFNSLTATYTRDPRNDLIIGAYFAGGGAGINILQHTSQGTFAQRSSGAITGFSYVYAVGGGLLNAVNRHMGVAVGGECISTPSNVPCIKVMHLTLSAAAGYQIAVLDQKTLTGTYSYGYVADLAVGDLDNDGDDDIAVVAALDYSRIVLSVFRQGSDGKFTEIPTGVELPVGYVNSLELADIDGDGRLDAIIEADDIYATMAVVAYQDPASSSIGFYTDLHYVASGHSTQLAVPADMNGDGRTDIVTLESNLQSIRVLPQR